MCGHEKIYVDDEAPHLLEVSRIGSNKYYLINSFVYQKWFQSDFLDDKASKHCVIEKYEIISENDNLVVMSE